MPTRRPVIFDGIAHHHVHGRGRIRRAHDLPARAQGRLPQTKLDGRRRIAINQSFKMHQPRLPAHFPSPTGRVIRPALSRPDFTLAVNQRFKRRAQFI